MHTHKLARPQTYEARLEAFAKASEWHVNAGMVKAKSLYAVAKARQLRTLQTQLEEPSASETDSTAKRVLAVRPKAKPESISPPH
jgi:hypothetical protein